MTTANKINFEIMIKENNKISVRQKEIVAQYLQQLDQHLSDLKEGKAEKTFEIKDLAGLLYVSPKHLSILFRKFWANPPVIFTRRDSFKFLKNYY